MKKIQIIVFVMAIIVAALYFIFTLSFSTGWALGEPLGDFFDDAQAANKHMFQSALYAVVSTGFILVLNTHKNKQFFFFNYIPIVFSVYFLIQSGIITLNYMEVLRPQYEELSGGFLRLISAINYSEISTRIFDLGITISIIMFIEAGLLIAFTIYKVIDQIKRAKIKKELEAEIKISLGVQD